MASSGDRRDEPGDPVVTRLPRLVIAAPASGHGKTTVATGLMAALRRAGHAVSGHKVGPDFIDPGYHALATGRPGRNLDPHLQSEGLLTPLLLHGAAGADIAVVEGVMGLYDGMLGTDGFASTAHVAAELSAPVILVVDVSHASRSVAAVVHGMASFGSASGAGPAGGSARIAGVILNKAGSERHAREVTDALAATGIPVLGVLRRDDGVSAPSRHLGLVPAAERAEAAARLDKLAGQIAHSVDLGAVMRIARGAPALVAAPWDPRTALTETCSALPDGGDAGLARHCADGRADAGGPGPRPVVAVAGGRAFTFRYAETDELLRAAGCTPVVFDPMRDERLPAGTSGIYLGGGFPEVHAADLSANAALRAHVRAAVEAGVPTVAECAGMLYLCRSVAAAEGRAVPMVGALDAAAAMGSRLTLGYRTAVAPADGLLGPAGTRATGHEFHRTQLVGGDPDNRADHSPAWLLAAAGPSTQAPVRPSPDGFAGPALHASYLHTHWAGQPHLARAFVEAVRRAPALPVPMPSAHPGTAVPRDRFAGDGVSSKADTRSPSDSTEPDLHHHGDAETAGEPGLVDLAVNVSAESRPVWLDAALRASLDLVGAYPGTAELAGSNLAGSELSDSDPAGARRAIAARHGRDTREVLPTAGGAEAFTLLARARRWRRPVVIHPQFTEPEAALRAAGYDGRCGPAVHRVLLREEDGFRLDPALVPEDADLVIVGNPTNPTSVLHPAAAIRALLRPGRIVAVDEAFMDAVPAEAESLAGAPLPALLVVRSLTKTWAIPGLRAGYVLGAPDVLADLAAQQPPWSVSTPAAAAMVACSSPEAVAESGRRAARIADDRATLVDGLSELDPHSLHTVNPAAGPFVLVRCRPGTREALRERGFAVRRGDTFPGLAPVAPSGAPAEWVRVAVRGPDVTGALLAAWREHLHADCPAAPASPAARVTV